MLFFGQDIVPDERQEQRWRVIKGPMPIPGSCSYLHLWEVEDVYLSRQLYALSLCYDHTPASRWAWDIPGLRRSFHQLVQALSLNHLSLPEPIDYSTYQHPTLPKEWAKGEPFLVFAGPGGHAFPPFRKLTGEERLHLLRRLCLNTAYTLRDLHQHGCVIRALPFAGVRRNAASGAMILTVFPFLCEMHQFQGFSRHEAGFHPPSTHAAPECFATEGRLSPATDVYALGRMLLEALGEKLSAQLYSVQQIEDMVERYQLGSPWGRFFKLALSAHPRERFDGMGEIISYVNSMGQHATPHHRWIQSDSTERPRTQRPDAPPAALLIWADRMLPRERRFRFREFLAHCQSRYSLRPLLVFTREQRDMNNAFFQFLRGLSFEIIPFSPQIPIQQWLSDVQVRWRDVPRLVIVGHTAEEGCQLLLKSAGSAGLSVELYPTGGETPSPLQSQDVQAFIDHASRGTVSAQLPSRMHRTSRKK